MLEYWVDVVAWKKLVHLSDVVKKGADDVTKYKEETDTEYKEKYVVAVISPFSSLKK